MRRRIDPVDRLILKTMQLNARMPNQDVAAKVSISPSACLYRVRRLESEGVIRRYLLDVDLTYLDDWVTLWAEVVLTPEGRAERKRLEHAFATATPILEARQLVGRADYLLKIAGRDASEWPALVQHLDPDARLISSASVQFEAKIAKHFAGLPQLAER